MRKKISLDVGNPKDDEKCAEIRLGQLHFSRQACRKQNKPEQLRNPLGEKTTTNFFLEVFLSPLGFTVSL